MRRQPRTLTPLLAAFALALSLWGGQLSTGSALAATPHHGPSTRVPAASRPSEITLGRAVGGGAGIQMTMLPVGLSLEYPVMAQDLGTGACPPAALVAELQRLGSPPLALAGASQDMTAPGGALTGQQPSWEAATLYPLPAEFWSQLHCLLSSSPDPLTVGINAKKGELSWATQIVAGAQSAATAGLDFSLGNEPDLYSLPNYASLDKPTAGEETAAVTLYLQVAKYLQQAVGSAPVQGPELANPAHWQHELPRVIEELHEQTVGVHAYPLSVCGSPKAVTIGGLLSAGAANAPRKLAWVVADANAAQVPAIISEANSASCGGKAGVSDSPAAAVWAVRFVLSALETGFREVRFHFSGGPYDPFIVRGTEVISRPLESALVALNQWLPIGSSLKPLAGVRGLVATTVATASATPPSVTPAPATTPPSAAAGVQLILDNEQTRAQAVVLRSVQPVRIQVLSAVRAGTQATQLSPSHGRVKLVVAANSVLAVSSTP